MVAYLSLTDQWGPFWEQAIRYKVGRKPDVFTLSLLPFFGAVAGAIRLPGLPVLLLGLWALIDASHPGSHLLLLIRAGASARWGGLVWLVVGWMLLHLSALFQSNQYLGIPDMLPLLFLLPLGGALGAERLRKRIAHSQSRRKGVPLLAVSLALLAPIASTLAYRPHYTLAQQEVLLKRLALEEDSFLAINAEAFYVLADRRAPWPTLRLTPFFVDHVQANHDGCESLHRDLAMSAYETVIVQAQPGTATPCLKAVQSLLWERYGPPEAIGGKSEEWHSCRQLLRQAQRPSPGASPGHRMARWWAVARCGWRKVTQPYQLPLLGAYQVYRPESKR
jgi:hypothetical protein